jgi:MFS family permease
MALHFPGENVNLLVTLPSLFIIPTALVVGRLSWYISRKTLLTIGQILYIIGGVGAAWFSTFEPILIMRILLGVGCGIVYPIVPTLIAQFYSSHERVKMMGRANAVGGIIAMSMSLISGLLATISWRLPYYVDLFFIVVLVMQLIFLPKIPPERELARKAENETGTSFHSHSALVLAGENMVKRYGLRSVRIKTVLCVVLMFVAMTIGMVYLLKMSFLVLEQGIGDSAFAGLASSVTTGAAFVFALTFPVVFKRCGRYTVIFPLATAALSFVLLGTANAAWSVLLGALAFGCYLGYLIPYLQTTLSGFAHPSRRTLLLSVLSAAMYAGQALSAPYVALVESLMENNIPTQFYLMAVCFFTLALLATVYLLATKKAFVGYPYGSIAELENEEEVEP